MSSAPPVVMNDTRLTTIQTDSLLDCLYSFYSVDELNNMLSNHPGDAVLNVWNVSLVEFNAQVLAAIDFVTKD